VTGWIARVKAWRQARRRARKFARRQKWSEGLSVSETFEKIYAENKWGRAVNGSRFYSGNGSQPEKSRTYEDLVVDFINGNDDIRSWVDIGCGDFQVAGRILERLARPVTYVGCDVASNLVSHNSAKFGAPRVSFVTCNAAESDPPGADLVTIRQVLQHLSNADIARILERIRRLYRAAIITESLPTRPLAPNLDIRHGIAVRIPLGSGVYVDEPPFSLTVSQASDSPYSEVEFMRTSIVRFASPAPSPAPGAPN
jgi:SAM-dependent methyltransferase